MLQLRPVGAAYARKATIVFEGKPVSEELYVWRGDLLAFAGTGARMVYRTTASLGCFKTGSEAIVAAAVWAYSLRCTPLTSQRPLASSLGLVLLQVRKQHLVEVGTSACKMGLKIHSGREFGTVLRGETLPRAYSWSAELVPMKCERSSHSALLLRLLDLGWDEGLLPLRDSPSPTSSYAHCAGATWEERSCRFRNLRLCGKKISVPRRLSMHELSLKHPQKCTGAPH